MEDLLQLVGASGKPVMVTLVPQNNKNVNYRSKPNKYERVPQNDVYCNDNTSEDILNSTELKAFAMPSPQQIIKGFAVIPVILETGKKILVGIFDIRDIWNDRSHPSQPQLKAMILPDNFADIYQSAEA